MLYFVFMFFVVVLLYFFLAATFAVVHCLFLSRCSAQKEGEKGAGDGRKGHGGVAFGVC